MRFLVRAVLALSFLGVLAALSGDAAAQCVAPLTDCSGVCTNTDRDNENCGSCGNVCAPGEVCGSGICALSCQQGLTNCFGFCDDLGTSRENCGSCGVSCDPGEICTAGSCAVSCQAGLADCAGTCVDLDRDRDHCGGCGIACGATEICEAGSCAPVECPPATPALPLWGWIATALALGAAAFWALRRRHSSPRTAVVLLASVVLGVGLVGTADSTLRADGTCSEALASAGLPGSH